MWARTANATAASVFPRSANAIAAALGSALGVALLAALAWKQIRLVGDFRVDDAYITFSFAKNLAAGHGPVFSHGVRVEGYSNFLWMVLIALGYLVRPSADPYTTARCFAFLFLAGALAGVYRLVRPRAGRIPAFVALALVLSNSDIVRAALSGLETVPFLACIVLGWASYLDPARSRRASSLGWFAAAALMRIDGFVPLFTVLGYELVSSLAERRWRLRSYLAWAAPAVGLWLGYFVWRYRY